MTKVKARAQGTAAATPAAATPAAATPEATTAAAAISGAATSDRAVEASAERGALPFEVVTRTADAAAPPVARHARGRGILRLIPALVALLALLLAGGVIGIYFQPPGLRLALRTLGLEPGGGTANPIAVPASRAPSPPAAPPAARAPVTIAGIGRLVPRNDVITIAPPYGAGDARIAVLKVMEGAQVTRGDVLAVLDNERALRVAVEVAQATLASREASLRQVREMVIASRDDARAALARAEAAVMSTRRDLDRASELRARGVTAEATLDQRRAAYDQAVQDAARAKAALNRYTIDEAGAQADILVAASNIDAAKADLARAEADLEKAYVRAPISGTVLTVHLRPGEKPGAKGIMNLGDLDDMTAEIEIYQTQIGAVTVGAAVTVSADALPRPLTGSVMRIGLEVGKQTMTDASPAANTDARVVKVYVRLDPASIGIAKRFTNLQVTGRITATAGEAPR